MRVLRSTLKLLAVVVPVALLAGCDLISDSKETAPAGGNPNWEETTDLTSPYGGYEFTDESDAFGDPLVQAVAVLESGEPVETGLVPSDSTFALRITWGQLEGNREAMTPVDWTGSISISQGAMGVLRTIAFERPRDHLLRRTDRRSVEFVSHTQRHYDGLLLLVHENGRGRDLPAADGSLTFATGRLTQTWSFADLRNANLVIPVDDLGNAVSVTGIVARPDSCPNGFTRGAWLQRGDGRAIFRGVWTGPVGGTIGHIRGHAGVNDMGEHVWFAKIVGARGRLIGLARGTFEPSEDPMLPGGLFTGHFVARPGDRGGAVGGRYVLRGMTERGHGGFFEGRWHANCDRGAGEEEPPSDGNPES